MKKMVMCTRTGRIIVDELTPEDKANLYTRCMAALLWAAGYELRGPQEDVQRICQTSGGCDNADTR